MAKREYEGPIGLVGAPAGGQAKRPYHPPKIGLMRPKAARPIRGYGNKKGNFGNCGRVGVGEREIG
jgi:hypothetical protein